MKRINYLIVLLLLVSFATQAQKKKNKKVAKSATVEQTMSDNVKFLVKPSPMRGTNGIMWGPDDKLYVGSVWHNAAFIVDPKTGEYEMIEGSRGTDDLAFHPDGRLFFNWIATGEVGVMDTEGNISVAAKVAVGNDGIAINDEGRIFVSGQFADSHLFEIYPDDDREPRMITNEGMRMSNAMDFGPDGKLYGSAWVTGEAIQIDMEDGATEMVGEKQGANLSAAKFNSKGELHVMDAAHGVVYKVNQDDQTFELVAQTPYPSTDNFCFGPDDRMYVTSSADCYVYEMTGLDTYREIIPGGLGLVGGVTFTEEDGKPVMVVVDIFAIRKMDHETGKELSAARGITMTTDVGWMMTVEPYDGQQVVTTSWTGNFVKLWDLKTNSMVANFDQFKYPTNAIAPRKDMIIFSEIGGAVKRFSPAAPDKAKVLADSLKQPFGLAYDNGDLYVSEDMGGRVIQIMDDDKVIAPKVIKDGLSSPQGLAIDNGKLYVVEAGKGQLISIDMTSGATNTIATGMEFSTGQLDFTDSKNWTRGSVAIMGGQAYVTGAGSGAVYKIDL